MQIVKYVVVLIKSIYISTVTMLWYVAKCRGKIETETIRCHLDTKEPFYQMLICIGITLTPGTIVRKKVGSEIHVLKLRDGNNVPHQLFDSIFQ